MGWFKKLITFGLIGSALTGNVQAQTKNFSANNSNRAPQVKTTSGKTWDSYWQNPEVRKALWHAIDDGSYKSWCIRISQGEWSGSSQKKKGVDISLVKPFLVLDRLAKKVTKGTPLTPNDVKEMKAAEQLIRTRIRIQKAFLPELKTSASKGHTGSDKALECANIVQKMGVDVMLDYIQITLTVNATLE